MKTIGTAGLVIVSALALAGCSDITGAEVDVLSTPPLEHSSDVDELTITEGTAVSVRLYAIADGSRIDPTDISWTLEGTAVTGIPSTATNEADNSEESYLLIFGQKVGDSTAVGSSTFHGGEARIAIHVVPQATPTE